MAAGGRTGVAVRATQRSTSSLASSAHVFPDKVKAYSEARRVLGHAAVSCSTSGAGSPTTISPMAVTDALTALFPQDPPLFMARTPHGYHDIARIREELVRRGFQDISIETVDFTSKARSARDVAIAYCQGTPLRNEIVARDALRLEEATNVAEVALAKRFGSGAIEGSDQRARRSPRLKLPAALSAANPRRCDLVRPSAYNRSSTRLKNRGGSWLAAAFRHSAPWRRPSPTISAPTTPPCGNCGARRRIPPGRPGLDRALNQPVEAGDDGDREVGGVIAGELDHGLIVRQLAKIAVQQRGLLVGPQAARTRGAARSADTGRLPAACGRRSTARRRRDRMPRACRRITTFRCRRRRDIASLASRSHRRNWSWPSCVVELPPNGHQFMRHQRWC